MPTLLLATALGPLDWLILAGYCAVVLAIGWWASRGGQDDESYFLGGRKMPAWAVAMSLTATALSAATFIGGPQDAFAGNLSYLMLNLGQVLGVLVVAFFFIPAFYRAGTITIYGYLEQRMGPGTGTAAGVAFLVGRLLASGARLFIAGIAFSLILYGDLQLRHLLPAIVFFGILGTVYTALGGIKAVIWTDTLQLIIVIGSAVLAIVLLMRAIPLSVGETLGVLADTRLTDAEGNDAGSKLQLLDLSLDHTKAYTLWAALAMTAFNAAAFGTDQDLVQRLLTTRSPRQAIGSLLGAIALSIPVTALFLVIGLLLFVFYTRPDVMGDSAPPEALSDSRAVYPQFLLHHLPAGVRGLALAGLFAAAMSSLDSAINAMASSAVADVWRPMKRVLGRHTKRGDDEPKPAPGTDASVSRGMVVGMGALLTLFAVFAAVAYDPEKNTLIKYALGIMTFAYAGLLGVFLTAVLTPRGNLYSVIAALLAGAGVIAGFRFTPIILDAAQVDTLGRLLGIDSPFDLAFPYVMLLGTAVSVAVCCMGKTPMEIQGATVFDEPMGHQLS
ncbi:MAG: sodium:solute symporter [Planctomycetota bacterium]